MIHNRPITRRALLIGTSSSACSLLTANRSVAGNATSGEYDVIALSQPIADGTYIPWTINNRRLVTGTYSVPTSQTGFGVIWENGSIRLISDISTQAGVSYFPYDANDSNAIVGGANEPFPYQIIDGRIDHSRDKTPAFRITGSTFETLPLIDDRAAAVAHAINQAGVAAGWAEGPVSHFPPNAVIWSGDDVAYLDDTGYVSSQALGINNAGDVVGYAESAQPSIIFTFAAAWLDGKLETLPLLSDHMDYNKALAINDARIVVGMSANVSSSTPWTWSPGDTSLTPFAASADLTPFEAVAINEAGWIVGTGVTDQENGYSRGVMWRGGEMIDLNTLLPPDCGLHIIWANDINDHGDIAATAAPMDGEKTVRAVILVPHS